MDGLARASLRERVRAFIGRNFYVADLTSLADDSSLVDTGIVDSTGILEVLAFIEAELGLAVADAEAVPANLDSVDNIVAFVERKRGSFAEEVAA
jgi:acyl carrier protein